jgi:hypothetical protein
MRIFFIISFLTGLLPFFVYSQNTTPDSLNKSQADTSSGWTFYAEADNYLFPAESDILTIITMADRGMVHLEARYNYEERNSASVFGGVNFTFGNKLQLVLTPMAGIVFGRLNGFAPGLETNLSYKKFNFNSQTEWVFDFSGKEGNFIYTYLQLGATVVDHFDMGFTAQRTRLYQTNFDIQRGVFAQYSFWKMNAGLSYFNPFSTGYFFLAIVSIDF